MLVAGEAGVGKTRLIKALEDRARGRAVVLRGECMELEAGELPYAPFVAAIAELTSGPHAQALDDLAPDVRLELARVFPGLGPQADPDPAGADARVVQARVARAGRGLDRAALDQLRRRPARTRRSRARRAAAPGCPRPPRRASGVGRAGRAARERRGAAGVSATSHQTAMGTTSASSLATRSCATTASPREASASSYISVDHRVTVDVIGHASGLLARLTRGGRRPRCSSTMLAAAAMFLRPTWVFPGSRGSQLVRRPSRRSR